MVRFTAVFGDRHHMCQYRRCTEWACGKRYARLLCSEYSPMVQLLYLALVIGGACLYWSAIHPHLPGPYLSPVHRYALMTLAWHTHKCCYQVDGPCLPAPPHRFVLERPV